MKNARIRPAWRRIASQVYASHNAREQEYERPHPGGGLSPGGLRLEWTCIPALLSKKGRVADAGGAAHVSTTGRFDVPPACLGKRKSLRVGAGEGPKSKRLEFEIVFANNHNQTVALSQIRGRANTLRREAAASAPPDRTAPLDAPAYLRLAARPDGKGRWERALSSASQALRLQQRQAFRAGPAASRLTPCRSYGMIRLVTWTSLNRYPCARFNPPK